MFFGSSHLAPSGQAFGVFPFFCKQENGINAWTSVNIVESVAWCEFCCLGAVGR